MHPVLFRIAGFEVRSYGVLIAAGILAGLYIGTKETARKGMGGHLMAEFAPYAVVFGLLGSRLLYAASHPQFFAENPVQILNIRAGGLNFTGGLVAGFLTGLVFTRKRKVGFWEFADCAAPAIILALVFGRIGCFLNGCSHGVETEALWAVTFENPRSAAVLGVPVHPTQLYEAAGNLAIFGLVWSVRKKEYAPGTVFLVFAGVYSALRIFLERFRFDTLAPAGSYFAWTDIFFAAIIIVSAGLIIYKNRRTEGAGKLS